GLSCKQRVRPLVFGRIAYVFFFSSRRRHTRCLSDWSSDVCSSDLGVVTGEHGWTFYLKAQPGDPNRASWLDGSADSDAAPNIWRSEERRVGKECRSRGVSRR